MGSSNRCTLKTITVFHIAFFFSFLLVHSANAIPTAEDINSLAEKARQTTDTFIQKSFQLRMAYEYSGKFLTRRDKEQLNTLATRAGDQLLAIEASQRKIKQQIEDYQGDDWDDRYGSTGLWRKSAGDLYGTTFCKCEVDFYLALASRQPQRNEILRKILSQIDTMFSHALSNTVKLLKIKTLILLAQTEPHYKAQARDALYSPDMIYPNMPCEFDIRRQIQKIIFTGQIKTDQLNKLTDYFFESDCSDDFELVLSLAFLQRRLNRPQEFEKTVQFRPQTEDFIGSLVLSDLSHRVKQQQSLRQVSVFEAELAAQAAWKNKTKEHKTLLGRLSGTEKFQTPLILYVTAIALADSLPVEAANLLIKASTLQQLQKSDRLITEAHEIAKQAAQLAYGFYNHNKANCRLAVEAFGNYHTIAAEKIDEQLEYLYTTILNNCGQVEKSKTLLENIANRPTGHWRNRARLDLITTVIRQSTPINREKRSELLKQLDNLITDCRRRNEDNKLRTEVINVYCRLLLESKEKASARKVLDILTDVEIAIDPNLNLFKANALRQLGELDKSAESLCEVANSNSYKYTEAMELLSESIDKIDYFQAKSDGFPKMVKNCYKLASYCRDHASEGDSRCIALMLVEISALVTEKEQRNLSVASELVNSLAKHGDANDISLLRCRARLLTTQGKFAEAARLWAQIAKIHKNETNGAYQRTWKWWRAKFYEMDCFAKTPQTEKQGVLHTIEVFESSYTDIPPLWAEKLDLLKQKCRYPEK
ncbi:MAG: hypothetical protein WBC22_19120 [Sedimentisphaerales bacterium]